MKTPMKTLARLLPFRFAAESRGSVTVETLIIFPTLAWALAATVVFFDGFRSRNQTQVAAQVVADLLSREANMFTTAYLEGMNDVFDFLADARFPTRMRISSVMWNSALEQNALQWSYGTRGLAPLPPETFGDLAEGDYETLVARFGTQEGFTFASAAAQAPAPWLAERIPPVLPGEALIMVESFAMWSPFANVGVGRMRFNPIVVTRPRFSPWINLEGAIPIFPESDYEVTFAGYTPPAPEQLPEPVPEPPPQPNNVVANQDFNTGTATGWSSQQQTATNQAGINTYLGPFGGGTWTTPVTRTLDLGAADRSSARVEFDLIIIDSWDAYSTEWAAVEGDIFQILIDGVPISSEPFAHALSGFTENARTSTVNHEGAVYSVQMTRTQSGTNFTGSSWNDQIWRVTLDIQAPPQLLTLGFAARLTQDLADEAFGIDNFRVTHESGTRVPASFVANSGHMTGTDPHTRFRVYTDQCPQAAIGANWLTVRNTNLASALSFQRRAGGTRSLNSGCNLGVTGGRISAQPTLVLNYTNDGNGSNGQRLRLRTHDNNNGQSCDSTLLVRDPFGQYWFNDDISSSNYNSRLNLGHAATGTYAIWMGRFSSGFCNTQLVLERY